MQAWSRPLRGTRSVAEQLLPFYQEIRLLLLNVMKECWSSCGHTSNTRCRAGLAGPCWPLDRSECTTTGKHCVLSLINRRSVIQGQSVAEKMVLGGVWLEVSSGSESLSLSAAERDSLDLTPLGRRKGVVFKRGEHRTSPSGGDVTVGAGPTFLPLSTFVSTWRRGRIGRCLEFQAHRP
ncbi:hypothetical protein F7725_007056 [Dissostichus mawsoni]|uniref:Uncharacterized protein n=1 Tax=Dissostichus mawsoni TaxID=36200 RepID=A0A7J5XVP5_DISMA|nr:hypothetical protein F7725_007056 [Dissostichus mawsoni]